MGIKDKAIRRGMVESFDLKPGDICTQNYWTEYQPIWREEVFDHGKHRTRRDGLLLYTGVKRRVVDENAKYPVGYVYCFWSFATKSETWISHGYPSYLRGKTFDVIRHIAELKEMVKK